ncbi:metallophosphoesterase [Eubacteriales bacterium OttesenSCG-928-A19]|nr:metallophosphoesterase [Eubacteriales bacterium OttesenSCG-928-A19]
MTVFAISDLHLPGGAKKPMDIFGDHWADHFERIREDWLARVNGADLVLLPGDTSWAMRVEEARQDLDAIGDLPGRKVLLRGNHDYWWSSISRVRAALPAGMYAIQNDALAFEDVVVCGSRGWVCPGAPTYDEDDARIYAREVERLSLSLRAARRLADARGGDARLIAMLHYPPFSGHDQPTEVTRLLTEHGVTDAVYGHLHGPGLAGAFSGTLDGVRYHLTSCDGLGFRMYPLP